MGHKKVFLYVVMNCWLLLEDSEVCVWQLFFLFYSQVIFFSFVEAVKELRTEGKRQGYL